MFSVRQVISHTKHAKSAEGRNNKTHTSFGTHLKIQMNIQLRVLVFFKQKYLPLPGC